MISGYSKITNVVAEQSTNFTIYINPYCGNGIAESGEQCDDTDLNTKTCRSLGYKTGELTCNLDCTYNSALCSGRSGGGGGGGGGGSAKAKIQFLGRAYPGSTVTLLKDSIIIAQTISGPDAKFSIALSNLTKGNYMFSIYGEDINKTRSALLTYSVNLSAGTTIEISGIYIAPTILVDKSQVKKGDNLAIFGQSSPESEVTIQVNSQETIFAQTSSDESGVYLYNLNTTPLEMGQHSTKSKVILNNEVSNYSNLVNFLVGTKNVASQLPANVLKGDLNLDLRVNLIDFSIAAYWYNRSLSEEFKPIETSALNSDARIDLSDFSIIAYYWTG